MAGKKKPLKSPGQAKAQNSSESSVGARVKTLKIDLRQAHEAHALSEHLWGAWVEAASVTLDRFHEPPPFRTVALHPPGSTTPLSAVLMWPISSEKVRRSHANEIDATEMGAYAIASVVAHETQGWRIVARTAHATGADIWMQRLDDPPDEMVRLEVSGMGPGRGPRAMSRLSVRLREKVDQLVAVSRARPGVAIVVGFEDPRVLISGVQQ